MRVAQLAVVEEADELLGAGTPVRVKEGVGTVGGLMESLGL